MRCQCKLSVQAICCRNSYYYLHVYFSVRCWFCILVSEQNCMSDWSGWAAMTAWTKLWESEWIAFIVATSQRNVLQRDCHSFTGPVIRASFWTTPFPHWSFVSNMPSLSQWKSQMRHELSRWKCLSWSCMKFNGQDYSILPACLLHLVLCAW